MSRARTLADLFNTDGNLNLSPVETINGNAPFGRKNLIINGGMTVAQRATATTTVSGAGVYDTIDRMKLWESTGGSMNSEQSTTAPAGFSKSLKLTVATADTSLGSTEYACFAQNIEAQDLQHLQYGTSSAKTITMSFYVRSNKTGTYCITIDKIDSTTYHYVKEFTINSADTWERKEITIAPDSNIKASGGAIADDNGIGLRCFIGLAWGSTYASATDDAWSSDTNDFATSNQVNWMDSTSNDFYFTGFQVEVGELATEFEHRSFNEELYNCKRYFQKSFNYDTAPENGGGSGVSFNGGLLGYCGSNNSGTYSGFHRFDPEMRANPTVTTYGNSSGHWGRLSPTNTGTVSYSAGSGYISNTKASGINFGQNAAGDTLLIGFGHITASAEL